EPRAPALRPMPGGRIGVDPSGWGEASVMSNGRGVVKVLIREICQPLPKKGGRWLGSKMPLRIIRCLWSVCAGPESWAKLKGFETSEVPVESSVSSVALERV